MILFAVMGKWGVYYLVNVAMGIGVVAVLNYALYDKLVFRREAVYDGKSL